MNSIKDEQSKTIKIYREFFIKAQAEIQKQMLQLKTSAFCSGCKHCCKIRYSEFSPKELIEQGQAEFWQDFVPLGATSMNADIDLKTNQLEAFRVDMEYAMKIIDSTDKDCWFYTCNYYYNGICKKSKEKPMYCTSYPNDIKAILHTGCGFEKWQKIGLEKLENEISKDIFEKIQNILQYKNSFNCSCCATCCKMACSEFSYEELQEKAEKGDNFAKQFISVFIPYDNEDEPRQAYGEYIDYLKETLPAEEKVYFYHCPKNKDNLCSDYENRPEICREFPTNPLMILPKSCGYKDWQEETHTATLLLHALVEIVNFYISKLKEKF